MSSFVGERLTKGLSFVAENAEKIHQKEFLRTEVEREYASLEDFTRIDPAAKRLVVIGCTGAGKSTLLNVMAGHKFEQSEETDMEFVWDKTPLFESKAGGDSVTKKTSFANLHWFGDAHRTFTAIDTPGHDDPGGADISEQAARDVLSELAADLHNKIKATGHVHAILVLHNDVASNRLNPATYQVLKMIDEKFAEAEESVWNNVIIGYSKCNHHDSYWLSGLKRKKADLQEQIRKKIPTCEVDVPIIALGGGDLVGLEDRPPCTSADFEVLWQFLQNAGELDTTQLKVFEGEWSVLEKAIKEKDDAIALAEAYKAYTVIASRFFVLLSFLFFRSKMLPRFLSFMLLNLPGPTDEIIYCLLLTWVMGPHKVKLSATIVYKEWWLQWGLPMMLGKLHAAGVDTSKFGLGEPADDAAAAATAAADGDGSPPTPKEKKKEAKPEPSSPTHKKDT